MADYKTRLTADTSQHDAALKKSAQQVYAYKKSTEDVKKTLTSTIGKFTKFTGAIGLSATALGGLKKSMQVNQQWADSYGTAIQTAKTVSEQFVLSITKADFSNFIGGLVTATKNAKELYNAMDALNTQKILSIGNLAKFNYNLTQAKLDVRNGVEGAADRLKKAEQDIENELTKQLPLLEQQLYAKVKEAINYDDIRRPKLDIDFVLHWAEQGDKAIENRITELKFDMSNLDKLNFPKGGVTNAMRYGEWANKYNEMRREVEILEGIVGNITDGDALKEIQDIIAAYWNLKNSIAQTKLGDVRYTKGASTQGTNKTVVKIAFEKGSIADIETQIKELQDRLRNEDLTGGQRGALMEQVKLLEYQKQVITDTAKPLEHLKNIIDDMPKIDDSIIDEEAITEGLQNAIDKIKETAFTIEDLENFESVGDGIAYVGDAFQSVAGIMSEEGGKMFSAIANSVTAVGEMIAKVSALMMAKGVTSVMDLPFPANMAALASVIATITSIISSIKSTATQSFADGGIFQGKTTVGDYNFARVNSGEMILNNRQQQHLFKLLNNPTISTTSTDGGNVTFTIHGSDLQGTLNNYNKRVNRVR